MRQIDVPSAAATLPSPSAPGTVGFFTDGNPVTGNEATIVPAEFLNMMMMELVNVVLAGGLTPSKTVFTQLRDAIANIAGGSANLAMPGHIKFPGAGLILNWGTATHSDGSGSKVVTFDLPFPNAGIIGFATNAAATAPSAFHGTNIPTTTGMTVFSASSSGAPAPSGTAFYYLALGR